MGSDSVKSMAEALVDYVWEEGAAVEGENLRIWSQRSDTTLGIYSVKVEAFFEGEHLMISFLGFSFLSDERV